MKTKELIRNNIVVAMIVAMVLTLLPVIPGLADRYEASAATSQKVGIETIKTRLIMRLGLPIYY